MSDTLFQPNWFSKPGDTLYSLMARRGMSLRSLAEKVGCDILTVRGLLAGTIEIDEEIAVRLAGVLGGTPAFWRRRQIAYERALDRAAEAVPKDKGAAWLRKFPKSEMASYGWVAARTRRTDAIRSYLAFFGVNGPEEWEHRYAEFENHIAFRTSPTFDSRIGALSAWLRQAEIQARLLPCASWNTDLLRSQLTELRKLTKNKKPAYFIPRLQEMCAAAGVAVVFVPPPAGCRASGAARFISPDKAMVILSFRYLSDDHLWFTFFHEIGHLILHGRSSTFVDGDGTSQNEREREANDFAAGVLVPCDRRDELAALQPRARSVVRFAVSLGVSPGIVVGQLQHLQVIGHNELNALKRRYARGEIASAFA